MGLFGELWVDEPTAVSRIDDQVPADLRPAMADFIARGYTVFPGAVSPALIDEVVRDTLDIFNHPERYVLKNAVNNPRIYADPRGLKAFRRGDRISDLFAISPAARAATFPDVVSRFLTALFREPAIAMQSISFEYGSQQAIHQDTAYVVSKRPTELAATWLALEDVEQGTGELIYYPGSHRFDDFLFAGHSKSWLVSRDGQDQHKAFLQQLHEQAKQRGLAVERFLPKKGDLLVWHSDLAHGGARITKEAATRRSLVTHFCPLSVKPNYADRLGEDYFEYPFNEAGYFTSAHFHMKDLLKQDAASILFDGGITKQRKRPQ